MYRAPASCSLLPKWINHLAFDARTFEDLERHKQRWPGNGITVTRLDWGNSVSIYTVDPRDPGRVQLHPRFVHTAEDRASAPGGSPPSGPRLTPSPDAEFFAPLAGVR
jgi:hypothetical protein